MINLKSETANTLKKKQTTTITTALMFLLLSIFNTTSPMKKVLLKRYNQANQHTTKKGAETKINEEQLVKLAKQLIIKEKQEKKLNNNIKKKQNTNTQYIQNFNTKFISKPNINNTFISMTGRIIPLHNVVKQHNYNNQITTPPLTSPTGSTRKSYINTKTPQSKTIKLTTYTAPNGISLHVQKNQHHGALVMVFDQYGKPFFIQRIFPGPSLDKLISKYIVYYTPNCTPVISYIQSTQKNIYKNYTFVQNRAYQTPNNWLRTANLQN